MVHGKGCKIQSERIENISGGVESSECQVLYSFAMYWEHFIKYFHFVYEHAVPKYIYIHACIYFDQVSH